MSVHYCHDIAHGGVPVLDYSFITQLYIWTSSCFIVCTICTSATLDLLRPS